MGTIKPEIKKAIEKAKKMTIAHKLTPPVSLKSILSSEKIILSYMDPLNSKNEAENGDIWAVLLKRKRNSVIGISRDIIYKNTIRFNVAHELGHYFLDEGQEDIFYRTKFNNFQLEEEKIYNYFAINLLVPDIKEFKEKTNKHGDSFLANYYQVPLSAIEFLRRDIKKGYYDDWLQGE